MPCSVEVEVLKDNTLCFQIFYFLVSMISSFKRELTAPWSHLHQLLKLLQPLQVRISEVVWKLLEFENIF